MLLFAAGQFARYDLFCVKSAVKPQPTNKPVCQQMQYGVKCYLRLYCGTLYYLLGAKVVFCCWLSPCCVVCACVTDRVEVMMSVAHRVSLLCQCLWYLTSPASTLCVLSSHQTRLRSVCLWGLVDHPLCPCETLRVLPLPWCRAPLSHCSRAPYKSRR